MAKDYHPLDSRYKGPSTAYTGTPKRAPEPVAINPAPAASGPWTTPAPARTDGPPPLPATPQNPQTDGPPALPNYRARPAKRRRSGLRVLIGLIIMAIIVGGNLLATRQYNMLIWDVESQLNAVEL